MTRAHILLTRPMQESLKTLETLQEEGFEVSIAPLLTIHLKEITLDPHFDAVIATSQHGVSSIKHPINCPIYVVGDASAAKAHNAGWQDVRVAERGNVDSLIERITREWNTPMRLCYVRAEHISQEIKAVLEAKNHSVTEVVSYRAEAETSIDDTIIAALPSLDCVVFYSLRSVEIWHALTAAHDTAHMTALCISKHTATAGDPQRWARILTADAPTNDSIMDKLHEIY
jgi:uroporphyrinogen-III synthase